MLTSVGPLAEVHRTLAVFAEAAGLDRDRVRRRARVHAAQAVFHGRRHCFRITRGGPGPDRLTGFWSGWPRSWHLAPAVSRITTPADRPPPPASTPGSAAGPGRSGYLPTPLMMSAVETSV
ncbi:hypothetical protein Sdia_32450 [Streptomyces diastaticus subsp. diastaticus]|uniref:Uncharacterized protein n=1 Tax=Streptomyces diastaticus subsp. diastaticus TaxID=68040 RepID=A0ABQ1CQ23_STRDI|nr:hypothetical protein Srut_37150 [Streptomyces rutgersensis]GFH72477.1 hypothetical protein Sdia_32450 [Streptomyces diastaticus subsp. diastaticus]GGU42611.1 hypothetical protein GCM10015534_51440 [Streptomyces diastaticus subsp. diastaticus]